MSTNAFARVMIIPSHVDWCFGDGMLLAQYKDRNYLPTINLFSQNPVVLNRSIDPTNLVEMEIHPLADPKIDYVSLLADHPSTKKTLRKLLKSKTWVPIMIFVGVVDEIGLCFANRRNGRMFVVKSGVLCDLNISFNHQNKSTRIFNLRQSKGTPTNPPKKNLLSYKVRFSHNCLFPGEIIDFDEADVVITAYDHKDTVVTDYVLIGEYDGIGGATIIAHQYLNL